MSLPSTSPLPSAFRLVRQILSSTTGSEGLTTKELVKEALKLYQVENPNYQQQQSGPSTIEENVKGKGKGKNVAPATKKEKGVNVIPKDHPFVSTSFLKSRVLATLQSQDLLLKIPQRPTSSTSTSPSSSSPSSSSAPASSSSSGKPTFIWKLSSPRQSNLSTPAWDFPSHWDRLISGQSPGGLYSEYQLNKSTRKEEEKQRGFSSGKVLRTDEEIRDWKDRKSGLTTTLERTHLNKRRAEKRPKKERKRLENYESYFGGVDIEAQERLSQVA